MSRWVIALGAAAVLALSCTAPAADPDAVKAKLDKARATYEDELVAAEKAVGDALDKTEAAARKRGDKAAIDKVKVDRELFELTGALPKSVPAGTTQKAVAARKALDAACAAAVKEYTKAGKDAEAAEAEKERAELKEATALRPRYFLIVNKGSELAVATEKEKGDLGTNVCLAKNTGADNQLWLLVPTGTADTFMVRNKASGHVVSAGRARGSGHHLTLEKESGDGTQWILEREGFHFLLLGVQCKTYWAPDRASKEPGTHVIVWKKEDTDGFRWNLVPAKPK